VTKTTGFIANLLSFCSAKYTKYPSAGQGRRHRGDVLDLVSVKGKGYLKKVSHNFI